MWMLAVLLIKVANTFRTHYNNQVPEQLPNVHSQKLLTLGWSQFPELGRERVTFPLSIKAANMSFMNVWDESLHRLTMMQGHTLLTHHWGSFSAWGTDCVTSSVVLKCGLCLIYERLYPIATQITQDARPTIINVPLTLILRMGQRSCLSCFWLWRQPIRQKRTMTYQSQSFAINSRILEWDHK